MDESESRRVRGGVGGDRRGGEREQLERDEHEWASPLDEASEDELDEVGWRDRSGRVGRARCRRSGRGIDDDFKEWMALRCWCCWWLVLVAEAESLRRLTLWPELSSPHIIVIFDFSLSLFSLAAPVFCWPKAPIPRAEPSVPQLNGRFSR